MSIQSVTMPRRARWLQSLRRAPASFKWGGAILAIHLIVAVVGPFVIPYGYSQMGTGIPLAGMSLEHPFGTDQLGRDILSRAVYGSHIVLTLCVSGTLLGLAVGGTVGLLCGYIGGVIDEVVQRVVEALVSIPILVLALLVIAAAGPQLSGQPAMIVGAVAFVYAPRMERVARAAALDIVTREYISVAKLRGEGAWSVMFREILPNASSVLLVEFALRAGYAPVLVGSLGFLGFGIRPPTPEWGLMISENRNLLMMSPITVLGPGMMLATLVIGLNLFTDGIAQILGRNVQFSTK